MAGDKGTEVDMGGLFKGIEQISRQIEKIEKTTVDANKKIAESFQNVTNKCDDESKAVEKIGQVTKVVADRYAEMAKEAKIAFDMDAAISLSLAKSRERVQSLEVSYQELLNTQKKVLNKSLFDSYVEGAKTATNTVNAITVAVTKLSEVLKSTQNQKLLMPPGAETFKAEAEYARATAESDRNNAQVWAKSLTMEPNQMGQSPRVLTTPVTNYTDLHAANIASMKAEVAARIAERDIIKETLSLQKFQIELKNQQAKIDAECGKILGFNNEIAKQSVPIQKTVTVEIEKTKKSLWSLVEEATRGQKEFKLFGQSMDVIEHVAAFLTLRRVLQFIITEARQSINAIVDLQKQVTQIMTISQNVQSPFADWQESIINLSDTYGILTKEVAAGFYQAISNQVAQGRADTELFMQEVLKFAVITRSTAAESVDLLSGAIKSYGMSVQDTEEIAAKFFKTIELGRIMAGELATGFGRISVTGAQMGVSFEELMAAVDVLSIKGMKGAEAITLIRNVMLKMLKPTGEMEKAFASWGVATGEQAVQAFGLYGVLVKLDEYAQGKSSVYSELFGRERATTGAIGLAAQADEYKRILDQIENAGAAYTNAQAMLFQSTGEQFSKSMMQIKNYFMEAFGTTIIGLTVSFNNALNKIPFVTNGLTSSVSLLVKAVGSLVVMKVVEGLLAKATLAWKAHQLVITETTAQLQLAGIAATKTAVAWRSLGISIISGLKTAGIMAAIQAIGWLINKYNEYSDSVKAIDKSIAKFNADAEAGIIKQADALKKLQKEYAELARIQALQASETVKQAMDSFNINASKLKELEDRWKTLKDIAVGGVNGALKTMSSLYDGITKSIDESIKKQKELTDAMDKSRESLADIRRSMSASNMTPDQEVRYRESEYKKTLGAGGIKKIIESGDFDTLAKLEKQAMELANARKAAYEDRVQKNTKNKQTTAPQNVDEATREMERLLEARRRMTNTAVDAETKKQQTFQKEKTDLEVAYADAAKYVNELAKLLGTEGVAGSLIEFKTSVADVISKIRLAIDGTTGSDGKKVQGILPEAIANRTSVNELTLVQPAITEFTTAISDSVHALGQLNGEITRLTTLQKDYGAMLTTVQAQAKEIETVTQPLRGYMARWKTGTVSPTGVTGTPVPERAGDYAYMDTLEKYYKYAKDIQADDMTPDKAVARREQFDKDMSGVDKSKFSDKQRDTIADLERQMKPMSESFEKMAMAPQVTKDLEVALKAQSKLAREQTNLIRDYNVQMQNNGKLMDTQGTAFLTFLDESTQKTIDATNVLKDIAISLDAKIAAYTDKLNVGAASPGEQDGGYIGNRDTYMTRLTPGEYVINPIATNMNRQLLDKINGGKGNVSMGDINITVKGGDTSRATIRNIATGIQRERYRRNII